MTADLIFRGMPWMTYTAALASIAPLASSSCIASRQTVGQRAADSRDERWARHDRTAFHGAGLHRRDGRGRNGADGRPRRIRRRRHRRYAQARRPVRIPERWMDGMDEGRHEPVGKCWCLTATVAKLNPPRQSWGVARPGEDPIRFNRPPFHARHVRARRKC